MRFVVAMAWREVRSSWRRLALFFLCVALGVGTMVSLRSFTRVFAASLADNSRLLFAADVRLENGEPWSPDHLAIIEQRRSDPRVAGESRMIETETIVRASRQPDTSPVMVVLRGVDRSFPLRGTVRLADNAPYAYSLVAAGGAVVTRSLSERLHVSVGDPITVGTLTLTVRAIAERVPGNALNFSPMPRVLVDYDAPAAAGLTGFGSRARYYWFFNVPDGAEAAFADGLAGDYRARRLRGYIGTYHWVESWLASSLSNIDGFLSLIGLAVVVLGGIGVASVTRVFVQQRIRTVAILKCLGGRNRRVLGAYMAQVLALSAGGSLAGLAVAQGITSGLAGFASARLPLDVVPRLAPMACVQGVAVGILIGLLFALPPLLDIRDVKPILVLRDDPGGRRRFDWLKIAAQALAAASVVALAGWMAGSYRNAGIFIGGLVAGTLVLHVTATVLMQALGRIRRIRSFVTRQGVSSLHRPGNQTRVVLFTVGLGALFIIAVRLMQANIQQEYAIDLGDLSADMFMIDVQPPQRDEVAASLHALGASDIRLLTVARARIVGVRRAPSNPNRVPPNRFGGEFRLTERLSLEPSETVTDGRFWPPAPSTESEVSVMDGLADWMALAIGDVLVFDVAGQRFDARVTSVRRLDRRARTLSSLVRADMLLRPGALDRAPHSYVGAARGPADTAARARLQNAFLSRFPGVTLVDALDDIREIRQRIADTSSAVSILGGLVVMCGTFTLLGSVAMTHVQRVYEAAVFKTLGAKRRVLLRITLVEYGVLGLLAGTVGSASSIAVTWTLSRLGNQPIPWHAQPWINITGALVTTAAVTIVGMLSTWDVSLRKPIGILRQQ